MGVPGACAEGNGVNEDVGGGGGTIGEVLGCKAKGIKGMERFTKELIGCAFAIAAVWVGDGAVGYFAKEGIEWIGGTRVVAKGIPGVV